MRVLLFALFVALFVTVFAEKTDSASTTPSTPSYSSSSTKCATTGVNVRASPSTSARALRVLSRGERVTVSSTTSGWSQIGNGQYVSAQYLGSCGSTPSYNPPAPAPYVAPVSSSSAYSQVQSAGIPISSSRNCRDRNTRGCTSLDGVRSATISGIISFKQQSGCGVTITGGTETGHSTKGTKNHGSGYKLDISLNSCVNSYITSRFRNSGVRSDGATMYTNPAGHVFAKEGNHWDIVF